MKKLMFTLALSLATAMAVSAADLKLGTVNMMLLVRHHPNYESNKSLLSSTEKDYQKKIDRMKEDLEKVQEEGKKLAEQVRNPMLAAAAKAKIEKDLIDIQQRFLAGQQKLRQEAMRSQQDLQDLEGRLLKATGEDLRKRIGKFAKDAGYDLVVDASAAIYAKESYDVTPEILKAMGVDPKAAEEYDRLYCCYKQIHDALAPVYKMRGEMK